MLNIAHTPDVFEDECDGGEGQRGRDVHRDQLLGAHRLPQLTGPQLHIWHDDRLRDGHRRHRRRGLHGD